MPEITIVTVNWFSSDYIVALLENLHTKAKQPENLGVLIIDNTNGEDSSVAKLRKGAIKGEVLPLNNWGLKGSRGHAIALDHAVEMLETEYAVIVDPDIYVFRQDWDSYCIAEMQSKNAIAIGAPYPSWKIGKYHDFPSPPFCFFHTKTIQKMKNGWTPFGDTVYKNILTFAARQIGRLGSLLTRKRYEKYAFLRRYADFAERVFGVFSQDTGWRLAEEVRKKGLKTIVFDSILSGDYHAAPENNKEAFTSLVREYEAFAYRNQLFLAHKYGTDGLPWRTKQGGNKAYWYDCIRQIDDSMVQIDRK